MRILRREGPFFEKVLPLFICTGIAAGLACCRATRDVTETELGFDGADGLRLRGTLYTPGRADPPGLVLLHMLGSDRSAWRPFAQQAVRQGYMVLAFDLRGHGDSTVSEGGRISFRAMDTADWKTAIADVAHAKQALVEAGADPADVGLVGASIGANLALLYARRDPQIQALVLISPGEAYRGLESLPAMEGFRRRPVLILAAEGDSHSAETARRMKDLAHEYCELRIYPGTAHGTDLLASADTASGQIFLWLAPILKAPDQAAARP